MVTSFNRKDLASFGNYLLSDARKATFEGWDDLNSNFDDALLAEVRPEDFYNWMDIQEKTFIDNESYAEKTHESKRLASIIKDKFATRKDLDNFFNLISDKNKLIYDEIDSIKTKLAKWDIRFGNDQDAKMRLAVDSFPTLDLSFMNKKK